MEALIWGNKTFMGQYNVPGGTVVFNPVLRDIYFTHQCFSVSGEGRLERALLATASAGNAKPP